MRVMLIDWVFGKGAKEGKNSNVGSSESGF
jgi:hypothetical protein